MWQVLCVLWILKGSLALEDVQIGNGIHLVEVPETVEARGYDGTLVSHFRQFLASHEVHVKLDEILPQPDDVQNRLKGALDYLNGLEADDDESGRKGGGGLGGGKKGGGAILMMATMMGGTMAALGFGAVGMLAMKALTVSAMALVLSAALGLKKLLSKGDDDGGHSVSYIPVHHGGGGGGHRKRRHALDLAYSAYAPYFQKF